MYDDFFFVISYPRSRTAWLTMYLNAMDTFAYHEGWKYASTAKKLRKLFGAQLGPSINVDSCNYFFLPEIRKEFPDAKYITIKRPRLAVEASLKNSYGDSCARLLDLYGNPDDWPSDFNINYDEWTPKITAKLMTFITGEEFMVNQFSKMLHGLKVEVSKDQMNKDDAKLASGALEHIRRKVE